MGKVGGLCVVGRDRLRWRNGAEWLRGDWVARVTGKNEGGDKDRDVDKNADANGHGLDGWIGME